MRCTMWERERRVLSDDAQGYGDAMGNYIVAYCDCDGLVRGFDKGVYG